MAIFSVMADVPNPVFDSNGNPFSGAVLKAFLPGGTTSISIAIDEDGGSPQASITYNAQGKLEVSGNEILPYIDRKHKWGIFANSADAAANVPFYMGPFDDVGRPTDDVISIVKKPIEEKILSAEQTTVTFSTVNIKKSEIFLTSVSGDGRRLLKDTDYTETSVSVVELTNSYPAGTICFADETAVETATFSESDVIKKVATLALAIAEPKVKVDDVLDIEARSTGIARSGGKWVAKTGLTASVGAPAIGNIVASTATPGLFLELVEDNGVASVLRWGATGDDVADDEPASTLAVKSDRPFVLFPKPSEKYKLVAGIEPLNNKTLWGEGVANSRIKYYGTGTAISFGESAGTLNRGIGMFNLKIELVDKTSKAVNLRATEGAVLDRITIEGLFQPFDNTRTNVGVHIDGANASSFFNRFSNIKCNHMHESYRIQTTGTLQATTQYFLNCTAFGDQDTDNSSVGYNIGDGGTVIQEGQGTVITGGNVEKCNTGFRAGNRAGSVTVDGVRIEIDITGTAFKFDFVDGCDPWTLKGINGLGTSYMEANSGIRNFDSANHILLSDDQGSMRLAGFDAPLFAKTFLGIGGASVSLNADADADLRIELVGDATGTGRVIMQAGLGSAAFGAFYRAHSAAHASEAGHFLCGPSSQVGSFKVTRGTGGAVHLEVDRNATADETTLLLFDITAGTLKRVSRGAADSESPGFRVLRIPN